MGWLRPKLRRLKRDGVRYDAHILDIYQIIPTLNVRMGIHYVLVRACCSYVNANNVITYVKSGVFLARDRRFIRTGWTFEADLSGYGVFVYVNPNDPSDYAVEILK